MRGPGRVPIRDTELYVDVIGHGPPLLLMHGGPGADHHSLFPFRRLADQFTLVFYDHRCNGRSAGSPVESMTWENLTADADALRERLQFERWAVLGHSWGGNVALEYVLRYPDRVTRLVLVDTGADSRWPRQNAARVVLERGYPKEKAELVRRFFNGELVPREMTSILMRIGDLYSSHPSLLSVAHDMIAGEWRSKMRAEPLIFAGRHLLRGWTVMDRLQEIKVPTLIVCGRDDFLYPPDSQRTMAARIFRSRLLVVENAGHNPYSERPDIVLPAVRAFVGDERK